MCAFGVNNLAEKSIACLPLFINVYVNYFPPQAYYLTVPFPVEKAATQRIPLAEGGIKSGVKVSKLMNYPVRGLVFEEGNPLNDLANVVSSACIWLQDNNVPCNVLISDSGRKIFLFPQVKSLLHGCLFFQFLLNYKLMKFTSNLAQQSNPFPKCSAMLRSRLWAK